jgi:SsrA-binding protein
MAKSAAKGDDQKAGPKTLVNRRARFDYELIQTFEAGVVLVGSEVKSVWNGRINLTDAYCRIQGDELWLINADIEPYANATNFQPDRHRDRKLLLHRKEITLIERRSLEKGLTIVPTKVYFNHGKVKVEIALARGKKEYDKRDQIAKDDTRRELERMRSVRF